jgi:hypothetical protein
MSSVTGTVRSTVVTFEERREHRRDDRHHQQDSPGPGVDFLRRPDRHVLEQTRPARDVDDQHHPEQQAERVEIDCTDGFLLVEHAGEDQQPGAQQRDDRPVQPVAHDDEVSHDKQSRRDDERLQPRLHRRRVRHRLHQPFLGAARRIGGCSRRRYSWQWRFRDEGHGSGILAQ